MYSAQQVTLGTQAINVFCGTSFCMSLGLLIVPLELPVTILERGIPPAYQGIILAVPNLMAASLVPLLNWCMPKVGLEKSIFYSNIAFVFACSLLGTCICSQNIKVYCTGVIIGNFIMTLMYFTNLTAEGALLLKYSLPEHREANLGKLRAASGLGGLVCPLIVSSLLSFSNYWTPFITASCILAILTPYITYKLDFCKKEFDNETEIQCMRLETNFRPDDDDIQALINPENYPRPAAHIALTSIENRKLRNITLNDLA
jgi:MFS family permease